MPAPRFVLDDFWPSDLFLGGIPGAWYDPTDLSTMFQDNTGLTPVTAVEQPVGLIFDKSQGTPAARRNLLTYSEQFDNAAWTKNQTTVTTNAAVAPDGTTTADTVIPTVAGGAHSIYTSYTYAAGVHTLSMYAKANGYNWIKVASSLTGNGVFFDVLNGAVGTANAGYTGTIQAVGSGWFRCVTTWTAAAGFDLPGAYIATANGALSFNGDGTSGVLLWGAQLEVGSTATTYQRITSGTGGEWTPGNHASQSTAASRPTYRARYNLLTYSEQFNNAAWTKAGLNTTGTPPWVDVTTAPDGTNTADQLIELATLDQHVIYQNQTVVAGTYTFSVYAKSTGGAQRWISMYPQGTGVVAYAIFDINAGAVTLTGGAQYVSSSVSSVGNGWFRCSVTFTSGAVSVANVVYLSNASNTQAPVYTGNGSSGAYIWGAQLLTAADVTATGNAYQRIAAATVYDTAPIFRPYLAFDGLDDSLATAALNLTSTSKATVFVGQTKNSDAAGSVILGHGVDFSAVGAWEYQGNTAANATTAFRGRSTAGSAAQAGYTRDVTSPATFVFVSIVDYTAAAGAEFAGRYNTVTQAQNVGVTEENTGTFGNNVLTIGARQGGASLRFNGRVYSVILRGAASSTTEIIDAEQWVNQRTGAF